MKRIAVVGGGFAGFNAIKTLSKEGVTENNEVVLIDKSDYFVYLPSLPYLLSRKKTVEDLTERLDKIAKRFDAQYIKGELSEVLLSEKKVKLSSGETLNYDFLILALGATTEFFNIPGAENTIPSWRLPHYQTMLQLLEKKPERICVVGAGLTGVEVAGELAEVLGPDKVTIVEKMPYVLPNLKNENASHEAEKILTKHGIKVVKGKGVTKVVDGKLILEDGDKLECDMIIWSVGIRAPNIRFDQKIPVRDRGWIVVEKNLQVQSCPEVFAVGDINCFAINNDYAMKMAEEAILQGKIAGKNISKILKGEKPDIVHKPIFITSKPRTLVSLGFNIGLLVWNGKVLAGNTPYMGKMLIEKMVMRDIKGEFLGDTLTSLESRVLKLIG